MRPPWYNSLHKQKIADVAHPIGVMEKKQESGNTTQCTGPYMGSIALQKEEMETRKESSALRKGQ